MRGLPEDETTAVRRTEARVAHDVVEVEGWPTTAPPFDPAQPAPTEPIPIEDERLRVGPDGTVEHERVRRQWPRVPNPFSDFWPALALVLLAALIALGALWYFTRPEQAAVPSVTTLPLERAVAQLQADDFKTTIVNRAHRGRPGIVFDQSPLAGTQMDKGSTVTIVVARGPANIDVPNAVGLSERAAQDRLAAAGLGVNAFDVPSDEPAGTVVAQHPAAGERVSKGERVRINVSRGRTGSEGQAPDVVGLTEQAARARLQSDGIAVTVVRVASDRPAGTVVSQTPAAGVTVAKDGHVALSVSKGSAAVASPATVGLSVADARSRLSSLGLTVTVAQAFSNRPQGTVVSQSPAAGTKVAKGARVQLSVSKGPAPVDVPDLVGLSRSEAEAAIRGAGLKVGRVIKVPSDSPVGTVVAQYPTAGQQRKEGSPVQFNVSVGRP